MRTVFRPALANALTGDDDGDLLLAQRSLPAGQTSAISQDSTTHQEESIDDVVDELFAEFAGVGELFE
jgi:hypothetical protein